MSEDLSEIFTANAFEFAFEDFTFLLQIGNSFSKIQNNLIFNIQSYLNGASSPAVNMGEDPDRLMVQNPAEKTYSKFLF